MWLPVLALIFGFVTLVWSADRFVNGSAVTAKNLGMSKLLIGLTVVALGTSVPEILVALAATVAGNPLLAIGNALGSNIANIGLVLGITALVAPLPFAPGVLRSELPWLMGATLAALIVLFDLEVGPWDSVFLLIGLGLILLRLLREQKKHPELIDDSLAELEEIPDVSTRLGLFWLLSGLVVLLASAEVLVWAAVAIAETLGVSELIIGLTIVAVGTSLPELAATIGSALKGHPDIAIGNVVGSNILNILAVLAVPGLITTTSLHAAVLWRDYGMMLALTLLLVLFAYGMGSRALITKFEGGVLVLSWLGYNLLLYYHA
ncbi:MAG: calcium/sodium antiporter [Gammaproteobacteria bacterium]|jgi:cation:H+ antiporter